MSRVTILVGSMRRNGNTDLFARSFADGASENNDVEIISVADYKVNPCIGCNACRKNENGRCFQNDDMDKIYNKLKTTDILVIASPVYFYGLSAQLKAIIDRFHAPVRNEFRIKKLGLLLVGADDIPEFFDSIKAQYKLTLNYFNLENIGSVTVGGAEEKGEIEKTDGLQRAFELGKSLK